MQLCPPCNTVRSGHFCICNRVRGYAKTVRRTLHDCTKCAGKRACMALTYAAWIFTYLMIAAITRRPKNSHVIHDKHLACKKMANVLRRPREFNLLQGRFCTGGHNCICKFVRSDTIALCSIVRVDMIAYAKPSGEHYCICNHVLRIVLHATPASFLQSEINSATNQYFLSNIVG